MKIIHIKDESPIIPSEFGTNKAIIFYESLEQFQNKSKNSFDAPVDFVDRMYGEEYEPLKHYTSYSSINSGVPRQKQITAGELMAYSVREFHSLELAEEVKNNIVGKLDIKTISETKKMQYNSLGRGVFSFDRAAQGLCRVYDFFSVKYQKFVDETLVEKIGENEFVLIEDNSVVERSAQVTESGQPKVRTTAKKVWVNFENNNNDKKYLNIFAITALHAKQSSESIMHMGAYLSVLADFYESKNYGIRIFACKGGTEDHKSYLNAVKIKDVDKKVDFNKLMIATGDVRFYRTQFFRGAYLAWKGLADAKIADGYGYPMNELDEYTRGLLANEIDPTNKELTLFIDSITSLQDVTVKHNEILAQIEKYEQRTATNGR